MATLPCVLAVETLLAGTLQQRGVVHPATWLAPCEWVARLQVRGNHPCGQAHTSDP